MIQLDHGHLFCSETRTLTSCSNGGLFSNFYHTIWSLVDLHNQGCAPEHIDFSLGFNMFRSASSNNLYHDFFEQDLFAIFEWKNLTYKKRLFPRIDHHGVYSLYPYAELDVLMNAYFNPSQTVKRLTSEMQAKYQLEGSEYNAVYYRGTDKGTEVTLPEVSLVVKSVQRQQQSSGITKCLVQTDDAKVLDQLMAKIEGAFFMDELPVIGGREGFHYKNFSDTIINPVLFSQRLQAMTQVLAQSQSITIPASNLAGWICLVRRSAEGVAQFNKHGRIVGPLYKYGFMTKNVLRRMRASFSKASHVYV